MITITFKVSFDITKTWVGNIYPFPNSESLTVVAKDAAEAIQLVKKQAMKKEQNISKKEGFLPYEVLMISKTDF